VQVAPIKPTLKADGTQRLKPEYDAPLSSCAFNCNLRRYTTVHSNAKAAKDPENPLAMAGRCSLTVSKPVLIAPVISPVQCLKLQYDDSLSNLAFNFILRHYAMMMFPWERAMLSGQRTDGKPQWQGLTLVHFSAQPEAFWSL